MAKRKTRTVCLDKLDYAIGNISKADHQLGIVRNLYFENGVHQGAQLELISSALNMAKENLEFFRHNVA